MEAKARNLSQIQKKMILICSKPPSRDQSLISRRICEHLKRSVLTEVSDSEKSEPFPIFSIKKSKKQIAPQRKILQRKYNEKYWKMTRRIFPTESKKIYIENVVKDKKKSENWTDIMNKSEKLEVKRLEQRITYSNSNNDFIERILNRLKKEDESVMQKTLLSFR